MASSINTVRSAIRTLIVPELETLQEKVNGLEKRIDDNRSHIDNIFIELKAFADQFSKLGERTVRLDERLNGVDKSMEIKVENFFLKLVHSNKLTNSPKQLEEK